MVKARLKVRRESNPAGSSESRQASPSQLDVAEAAGVSQAAVSRAFTPGASVAPETRARVLAAARSLGYRPNALARSLVTHRSNMIAIVMANMWNPFYARALAQFTDQLQTQGYWVLLFKVTDDSRVDDALLAALEYQVDGVIITSATLSGRMAEECANHGVPVVLFNRYTLNSDVNAVWCDAASGGRVVADTLLDQGYRRLGFLAGDPGTSTSRDREAGFRSRLAERGCELYRRAEGDFTYESGITASRRLLGGPDRPDAIFCANDLMAMATIDVATGELGLRVPEDVALIGFDDQPMAAWPHYNLTTIRQPLERLVSATVEVIGAAIEHPGGERVLRILPGELVVRGSCPVNLLPQVAAAPASLS